MSALSSQLLLQRAPNLDLHLDSSNELRIRIGSRVVVCGIHGLAVLDAFAYPTPLQVGLEKLKALGLTRRQAEVAFWIAQGKTNDDLAIILNTSHHTIPHHVEAILGRLHLATRAEIMLCVLETLGWLRWPAKRRNGRTTIRPKR